VKPVEQENQDASDDELDTEFTLQRAPRSGESISYDLNLPSDLSALELIQGQKPRKEVSDDGHIEFQETTSKLSTELARKGFTQWGINASLSASLRRNVRNLNLQNTGLEEPTV
jgi:hypothetical protein